MRFPFSPSNRGAGISLGDIYGQANPAVGNLEPATITTQNMDYTSRGNTGYNHPESDDFGAIRSLAFNMHLQHKDNRGSDLDGYTRCRCTCYDTQDNVVTADFEIPFVNQKYPVDLPITAFTNYRARKPRYFELSVNAIASLKLPKELDVQNVFEWRNIKLVSWQVQDFYDEFGRYAPEVVGSERSFPINNISLAKVFGSNFKIRIDDVHFTKTLLAIANDATDRNLEPEFLQRDHIMLFDQLLNDAQSQVELEKFQTKQFDFRSSSKKIFDLKHGDALFLIKPRLINDQDDSTNPSDKKLKCIVKRLEFSLTSPPAGSGGLTRRALVAKRFE